jgi:hypothetical protein
MATAHRIADLAARGPISRSSIYNAIRDGRLIARKIGGATVILDEDWRAMLANAPAARIGERQTQTNP